MITRLYYLRCDSCNATKRKNTSLTEEAESKRKFRVIAERAGWRQRRVPNGSLWDYCPECDREAATKETK